MILTTVALADSGATQLTEQNFSIKTGEWEVRFKT